MSSDINVLNIFNIRITYMIFLSHSREDSMPSY